MIVGIGPVEFQHGEFGVVLGRQPLVAEIPVQFIHLLETTHYQPLEKQLRCDAQVHILVESIMMGDKRASRGAAGNHLHHGCLHFHELQLVEVITDKTQYTRAHGEYLAGFIVHDEIHIALTITHLGIRQPLVLVRQWPQGLGQQSQI